MPEAAGPGPAAPVAGVVAAAGVSARFAGRGLPGGSKAFLPWHGRTLASCAADALRAAGCAPVLVVVRDPVDPALVGGARQVVNARAGEGLATSIRAGLDAAAAAGAVAAVVTLADTPLVGPEHVRRLLAASPDPSRAVAVASYAGAWRTPVLLGRAHWGLELAGDRGAGPWLRAHPGLVTPVDCTDLGPWRDVDTWADYRELLRSPCRG